VMQGLQLCIRSDAWSGQWQRHRCREAGLAAAGAPPVCGCGSTTSGCIGMDGVVRDARMIGDWDISGVGGRGGGKRGVCVGGGGATCCFRVCTCV